MQKALVILGMYAILFAIAGVEVYFKLKKDHRNKGKDGKDNCR